MKKLVLFLLLFFGVPLLASWTKHDIVSTVLGIAWILILIPWGILMAIDFYRTNDGTSRLSRVFNVVFRVPLALFGLVCVIAGVSIIGWVLYNLLAAKQKEYTGPTFITGWGSFGVSVPLILFEWAMLHSVLRRKEEAVLTPKRKKRSSTKRTTRSMRESNGRNEPRPALAVSMQFNQKRNHNEHR